jgi:transglutaminase-like putative cysteine protease
MRIRVSHEIRLAFAAPVRSLHLNLRLTPRSFDSQQVSRWRVGVDLDATLKPREDSFGSLLHNLSWHKPIDEVTITAAGEAETSDAVGVVRGAVEPLPADMYLRASPLAQANPALRDFAECAAGQGDTLSRLHALMDALHREIAFTKGFGGELALSETHALKKGGAADFAHAFIACARGWGVPARFITGYRVSDTGGESNEMFAWAEALAPELGWVAFDSVHNVCPDDRYVRVAVGLDAKDAAPVRFWINAGEAATTARLVVEQAWAQGQN